MSTSLGAILLIAHVVAVVVSYGALGVTGTFARIARTVDDPFSAERLTRFFRPGHNLAGRVLFLVPFLGFGLLFTEPSGDLTRAYPWIGLAIWTVSIAVATGRLWPAESDLQERLASGPAPGAREIVRAHARVIERSATVLVLCFLAAFVVMVARV
ncbi:MAG TPA: hypothetical protein VG368_00905 [Acidimicrobiales bacterium]|nr:hypothetical protein [Acidimicrobiales bacterium]